MLSAQNISLRSAQNKQAGDVLLEWDHINAITDIVKN